jgi:hypothetical protein
LIRHLPTNVPDLQAKTELFFKDWDNKDFTQDETEFIVEIEYAAMQIVGLKIDDLLILFVTHISVICVFVNPFSVFPLIHFP